MRVRDKPLISTTSIEYERWPDGINPYLDPVRREMLLETRAARDAEIKAWLTRAAESSSSESAPDQGLFDLSSPDSH
jgi:hypothetical protein